MGKYVVSTEKEQQEMLRSIGMESFEDLFGHIPEEVKIKGELNLPHGRSELETFAKMEELSEENKVFRHIFRGAGAYSHYIPSAVKSIVAKEEFVTAYTPYQAEISQGILQSIFEYQTMICELTGMEVSNASVYDGASAAAEATAMCRERKRSRVLVSATANPEVIKTIKTYCHGSNTPVTVIPEKDGEMDLDLLKEALDSETACLYVQQPNFYGILEDCDKICALVHESGAKLIMGTNPIALGILKTPAEYGADIAVGEGQPLGMPLSFGGPYLGYMSTTKAMERKLPGRIVGETTDAEGRRAFVLTLQAREQHIRREKASSNICSNEALCALTASVYLSVMGKEGLQKAARQCTSKAHFLQGKLSEAGLTLKYEKPFFHEFVTCTPIPAGEILDKLEEEGILGGLPIGEKEILWCATEKNTREEMEKVAVLVKEVCGR
ncbi:MAG TPA: aminomethyl-transferring glycine dehydrogenase subunit GcvPA [Candidatus Limivivens merdigallinarum]|uniref:Probable glycine dehydrogenase (decarboxylating) subunit 1 n=1 Tax=Candidatus Limivivens merdigallinarum TaxID=2840859 RepID=A0A9D1CZR3_9FIRM|nr:aminomethyl-transferring glycine dehydrogenase subunit GcvPA [Candidatus Limivivens merdigallinarum]